MIRRTLLALLTVSTAVALLSTAGCKPTTKGETQKFSRHKEAVAEYSGRWPGFKSVLQASLKKATKEMEEAKEVSGDEKKAEAMKEANETISKLTNRLGEVKYKSEGVEKLITKLNKLRLKKSKSKDRKKAVKRARKSLKEVDEAMKTAKPGTESEAMAVLKPLISKLISARGAANRAHKALGGKKSKKKKKKKDK